MLHESSQCPAAFPSPHGMDSFGNGFGATLAASTMWLLHHITSSCLRHDASVGLFGLLNEASRQNWRTTLGAWRHLGKRGRRKWRTTQVSAVLLSPLDHGIE